MNCFLDKRGYLAIGLMMTDVILSVALATSSVEHVLWDRTPISFEIPLGKERMITFPESVIFHNTNPELTTDRVSTLNNAGTLYIQAKKAFDPI